MNNKMVWVEQNNAGHPIRIVGNQKEAFKPSPKIFYEWDYSDAVASIRHQIWLRCKRECEICNSIVTEDAGHMHEKQHRGQGGEISIENSIFICVKCHKRQHSDREPKFTRRYQ